MSAAASNPNDFFDIKRIRRLAELMTEQDLSEIDLQSGDIRLRVRRKMESDAQVISGPATHVSPQPAARSAADSAPPAAAKADDKSITIKSPMVGTFYASSNPESPAFVKVGDHVGPETTVCIIEAMKVFNEIPAELSGKVVAVLASNGEPVEFNQPLFKVEPS
ncbi:MAG: acetyl-CoA carboxylase biotin carboxyl carrier protein [Pirellulales bacterium]